MRYMRQPDNTTLCAQTCVAMVAGVSLEEATAACGHTTAFGEGTLDAETMRGLDALGVKYGRLTPAYRMRNGRAQRLRKLPKFAIGFIHDNRTSWAHAVVVKDGFVIDPGWGYPLPIWLFENLVIERAYSRKYRNKRLNATRGVKARWMSFLPILEAPTANDIVGHETEPR